MHHHGYPSPAVCPGYPTGPQHYPPPAPGWDPPPAYSPAGAPYPPAAQYPPAAAYPPAAPSYPGSQPQGMTVQNPPVPYMGAIPKLADGTLVKVNGVVPHHGKRFYINLQLGAGLNERVDTALHVNPRFDENTVVRNSYLRKRWGKEERKGGLPMAKGHNFECIILATHNSYKIAFNGVHFCEYAHRVGMDQVTHVAIGDDIIIHALNVTNPLGPGPAPGMPQPPYVPPSHPHPHHPHHHPHHHPMPGPPARTYNIPMPCHTRIVGGFTEARRITIEGMVKRKSPNRFSVNLCYHDNIDGENAFHFNPRFDEKQVVRNTRTGHRWGREERAGPFPFAAGQHFQILIICLHDKYKVSINGLDTFEYKHRLRNLKAISWLIIVGDVMLSTVMIQ